MEDVKASLSREALYDLMSRQLRADGNAAAGKDVAGLGSTTLEAETYRNKTLLECVRGAAPRHRRGP